MKLPFITAGQIVNTHGIRGEVKLLPRDVEAERLALRVQRPAPADHTAAAPSNSEPATAAVFPTHVSFLFNRQTFLLARWEN